MHEDWGVRSERWAGVRSEWVDVVGTRVHVLRADATHDAPADALPQLLLHGLGGAATNWIEVVRGLAAHGPVIAPDLPGFGRTEPPHARAARLPSASRFLRAFTRELGIERAVVHGNSMGGLLALRLADLDPERVAALVLVDPALPAPLRSLPRLRPATLGRFAPFAVPAVGKAMLGRAWRRLDAERLWADNLAFIHGDGSRLSPEMSRVGTENLEFGRQQPWRLDAFTVAATSVVRAITVGGSQLRRAVDGVSVTTLLLWGDADRLVGRPVIDALVARRPDWSLHVFETVGHAPQVEVPDDYLAAIGRWYASAQAPTGAAAGSRATTSG